MARVASGSSGEERLSLDEFLELTLQQQRRVSQALEAERKLHYVEQALKRGHIPSERPEPPPALYQSYIRHLVTRAVFRIWNRSKEPAERKQIVNEVQKIIKEEGWNPPDRSWKRPGYMTTEARIRECCNKNFYGDEAYVTPIIRIAEGKSAFSRVRYMPNPLKFSPEVRAELLKVLEK